MLCTLKGSKVIYYYAEYSSMEIDNLALFNNFLTDNDIELLRNVSL